MKPGRQTRPRWRYDPDTGIVRVTGTNLPADLRAMKDAVEQGRIPISMTALVYQTKKSNIAIFVTGHWLSDWIAAERSFIAIFYSIPRGAMEAVA